MTAVTVGDPVPHIEDVDTIGRRWRSGVMLLIAADVAFVGSLVFSYFYLRGLNTEDGWFPAGSTIEPIWIGWAIAVVLVVSAAAYRWGQAGLHAGEVGRLALGAGLALLLLVADILIQIVQLVTIPFGVADSAYSSSIYVLAGATLFHLLLTLFVGVGIWNRSRVGLYTPASDWQVRLVGTWWTWVAMAAVISAFVTSFVTSPNHFGG
jgi:heme/copper-type cytochrome/quinol oxidase subunit 3